MEEVTKTNPRVAEGAVVYKNNNDYFVELVEDGVGYIRSFSGGEPFSLHELIEPYMTVLTDKT